MSPAARLRAVVPPVLAVLALGAVWQATSLALGLDGLPTVPATLAAVPDLLRDPDVVRNVAASLRRAAIGFAAAVALAVPLGLLMGRSRTVARLAGPLLAATYPVPKAALMPIIMLWLGTGDLPKTLVIVLGAALPIVHHAYGGARAVEEAVLWSASAMGMSAPARLARVILPAALPEILVGCRTGIVLALITMVTSEMIARQSGIGSAIFNALDLAQYEAAYALILLVAALGIVLDILFAALRARLVGWAADGPAVAAAGG